VGDTSISLKLSSLRERIAEASKRSRHAPEEVVIVAISKKQPITAIREALQCGLKHLGESKIQEAGPKIEEVSRAGTWHMVGHLQKNKAREAVRLFDEIDSVDSLELAQELSRHAREAGKTLPVLLQVSVMGESAKFGIAPTDAARIAEAINALPQLELKGLMTLAPYFEEAVNARPAFAGLRLCRDQIVQSTGLQLPVLSMGMSHDFEIAVEEGSNCVRIGTALFGPRQAASKIRAAEDL
jgi:PLP dependent protein